MILSSFCLEDLVAFQDSCKLFNQIILDYNDNFVCKRLEKAAYRTAISLYDRLLSRRPLNLWILVKTKRRISVAWQVANVPSQTHQIAAKILQHGSVDPQRGPVYRPRVARNAYPYVLGILQFFEEYRYRLASFTLDSNAVQRPSDQVEALLLARYNQKTVKRLCALFRVLLHVLRVGVPRMTQVSMWTLLGIPRTSLPSFVLDEGDYLDFFTFGGLEAFRDVIRKRDGTIDIVVAHFARATPIQLPIRYGGQSHATLVPRPQPIQSPDDNVTAIKICRLLPRATDFLHLNRHGGNLAAEQDLFLRHLVTYNGEEPVLLR